MSQPPTMSQVLKRAGLAKQPRPGRRASRTDATHKLLPTPLGSRETTQVREETAKKEGGGEEGDGRGNDSTNLGGGAGGTAVDDQIAALERELAGGSDSTTSGDGNGDEGLSSVASEDDEDMSEEDDEDNSADDRRRVRKLVSPLDDYKIEPLPAHLLPRPGCGVGSGKKSAKKAKKRSKVSQAGLASAVLELMDNYEARSSERVPFYCRVCKFQGDR